jgi:hypothetical protein
MGSRHDLQLYKRPPTPIRTGHERPNLLEPGLEHNLIQLCLVQQRARIPATIYDVIDYLTQKSITADWWWDARFVERHKAELTVQKASVLERSRYGVARDDVKKYFDILRKEYRSIPSLFVWNVDDPAVGSQENSTAKCNCCGKHQTRDSNRV